MSKSLLLPALLLTALHLPLMGEGTKQEQAPPAATTEETQAVAKNAPAGTDPFEGIVRIEAEFLLPDYRTPWQAGRPTSGNGTGWLVGKNKFITNAHVVSNSTKIFIRTTDDPKPYEAKIVHIAHDCDLAMLEPLDTKRFADLKPLKLDDVPKLDTEVIAVGYPIGGDRVSVTRGVVSRIDFQSYSHSGIDQHLAIQVDAAINPGNSGGPVLQGGKVVGVAFQGYSGAVAQNVGYMIPVPVINRFLKDIEDGSYDHYMDLAITDFPIENPAQIKALGLEDNGVGVMVANVDSASCAGDLLKVGDVLMAIDGSPVYNNGLIRLDGEMVDMNEVVERKFAGDKIKIDILRGGKPQTVELELKRYLPYLMLGEQYVQRPTYVLYAGMLFQPMTRNLMEAHNIRDPLVNYWFDNYVTKELFKERPEVVVLTAILPDEVNSYLQGYQHSIVDEINGVKIKNLKDVAEALKHKEGDGKFVVVKLLEKNRPLVLRRDLADAAQPIILQKYGVDKDSYLGD
ncbi:trypsin-like peptidase domain-containing protein [Roseimicrobium sp. ORNL1]|uniref:S1C family serine protease n=1 Tax=Roseimicrobium sp. ORNL1 TaxID=2711231 RepID=UPI0013E17BBA|nr:trypsin-like peptidase domain-containing protein [Roseimicrobium sp. ORNL1]QIF05627.1 trypsin-like serine protease [Roseimicrobium sp. ORNL1]